MLRSTAIPSSLTGCDRAGFTFVCSAAARRDQNASLVPRLSPCMHAIIDDLCTRKEKQGESLIRDAFLFLYKMYSVKLRGRAKPHM